MVTRRGFLGGMAAAGVATAVSWEWAVDLAAAASPPWLTARGSNARTGLVSGETAITPASVAGLRRRWTTGAATLSDTETLVRGSRLYSVRRGGARATLARLRNGDGSVVWTRNLLDSASTPAIDGGRIVLYTSDIDPFVSAFDVDSGAPLWSVTPPVSVVGGLVGGVGFASGKVVVTSGTMLSVLRAADGAPLREVDVSKGDFDSNGGALPMIDGNGTAWFAFKFLDTLAVPPSTVDPITNPRQTGNRAATPLLAGNRVLVAAVTEINAFDVATGAKSPLVSFPQSTHHSLAWDGTRVFASSQRSGNANALRVYNAGSGALVWEHAGAVTAPLVVNGMVVVGEDTAGLAVYRATNGQELARFAGTARGADPVVSNGQLLVGFSPNAVPAGAGAPLSRFTL